jgi:hypothetical protein
MVTVCDVNNIESDPKKTKAKSLLSGRDAGELKGCLVRLSVVAGGAWHRTNNLDIRKANAPPELSINSQIVDKQE